MKITKHQNTSVLPILQSGQGFTWTPEGLKSEELATWEDVPEDIKQLAKDINDREYEEHRRNNDVRFTGEKALEPEDWKFAAALAGGIGTAQAASTMGWIPAITTDVTSGIGGTAVGYGSNWIGQKIDNKFGTNVTPWLTVAGSLLGGVGGGIAGYKGMIKLGSRGWLPKNNTAGNLYNNQFVKDVETDALSRQLKQAPSKTDMDYYRDYNFLHSELTDPDRFVHVSPNPVSGKNVSVGAAHSNGISWVPGNAHVSKVGDDNMVWLWTGKPYRNRYSDQTFISIPKTEGIVQTRQPGAVGIPQIDLTSNTTKIITKNPITGGFEKQIVINSPNTKDMSVFGKFSFNKPSLQSKSDISKKINYLDIIDMDDLPEYTPSLEKSLNEFSYYRGNSENYERGRTAIKEYLQSEDYTNQIKKNIPDASEKEIKEIVQKQIDYIDNTNVWLSNRNISEPGVDGETIHIKGGFPEMRIYESGDFDYDRMTAKHEWLHAARGPADIDTNPLWNTLYWNGLIGEGFERLDGIGKSWYAPANLDLLEFKPHTIESLTPKQKTMMRYLSDRDEARVRALKVRDVMNQTGKSYDEIAKIISNPAVKGTKIGDMYQLFEVFTPESIKKYVDKIMTIGVPVTVGTTLKTLGRTEHYKQGGTLPYYLKYFNYGAK